MKIRAVAFEARLPTRSLVSWGAAALEIDEQLCNPRTGSRRPITALAGLVADGLLTPLPEKIILRVESAPRAIVCVFRKAPLTKEVRGDGKQSAGVVGHRDIGGFLYDIFEDDELFEYFAQFRARQLYKSILKRTKPGAPLLAEPEQLLLRSGIALAPRSGSLLALQAHFAPPAEQSFYDRMALATLSGSDYAVAKDEYQQASKHLRIAEPQYGLKFQKGHAHPGYDIPRAIRALHHLQDVVTISSQGDLSVEFDFVEETIVPANINVAKAASMEFKLEAKAAKNELDRVAWAARFDDIEKMVDQGIPDRLLGNPAASSLSKLLSSEFGDEHLHQAHGHAYAPVVAEPKRRANDEQADLRMLACLTGTRSGRLVQLRFPGRAGYVEVNAENNGFGGVPVGASTLMKKKALYGPVLVRVAIVRGKTLKYFLREIKQLPEGPFQVQAFPSALISKRFAHGFAVKCELDGGDLKMGDYVVQGPLPSETEREEHDWSVRVAEVFAAVEADKLKGRSDLRYFPRVSEFDIVEEVVGVLSVKGKLTVSELTRVLQRRADPSRRSNNILKAVRGRKAWFDRAPGVISLSEDGKVAASALRHAGWRMDEEHSD